MRFVAPGGWKDGTPCKISLERTNEKKKLTFLISTILFLHPALEGKHNKNNRKQNNYKLKPLERKEEAFSLKVNQDGYDRAKPPGKTDEQQQNWSHIASMTREDFTGSLRKSALTTKGYPRHIICFNGTAPQLIPPATHSPCTPTKIHGHACALHAWIQEKKKRFKKH